MDTRDISAAAKDELTEPERQLIAAAATGELVDLRARVAELDQPAKGATWEAARTVRAEVLAELLVGDRTPHGDRQLRAVQLRGARIAGQLDLEGTTLACQLLLHDCHFEQAIKLRQAHAPSVRLPGCHLPGLDAMQLETRGNLELNRGFTATGEVNLIGAHIGGQLDLSGASLSNPGGRVLTADQLTVDQSMYCRAGFTATGEMWLVGAHIGGQLNFRGATLGNPDGCALAADRLTVEESAVFGAGFTATGEVRLVGAHIGGQLGLSGASLSNPGGRALTADGIIVDRSVFCRERFTATGEVRLNVARVGETLDFRGATLTNSAGPALTADQLTVDQSMYCRAGFTATGEVNLIGAHIRGDLDLDGASLTNPGGAALIAESLTVDRNMFCRAGFNATGEVTLIGAHVGGQLEFTGATLSNPDGLALDLERVRAAALFLQPETRLDGIVDLTAAQVGSFHDDQRTWPAKLRLRGFVYDVLENDRVSVRARLGWLRRHQGGYTPQPYEQLAAAYRRDGRDEDARQVLIAKQWRRRGRLNPWNWLLYATVGYGYRTWLALLWLLIALVAGTRALDQAQQAGVLEPAKDNPSLQPSFHPLTYALDLLLPIVNLGQDGAWIPRGWAEWWTWGLILAGWVLTTAVVAGLTGVLKRD